MDSPNMKRISLYLDKKLVKKADATKDKLGYSSRNEFFSAMITRIIAQITDISDRELDSMRAEAINNVRRTRGKVHLDEILKGYYNDR